MDTLKPNLLLISHDVISKNMSGSAIRYWELAKALKTVVNVTLAVPEKSTALSKELSIICYDKASKEPSTLKKAVAQADVILLTGFTLHTFPFLETYNVPIVVDLYNLFLFENIEIYSTKDFSTQVETNIREVGIVNRLLRRGDFFLCASEKQKDFWLGMLMANYRLNPFHYEKNKMFHSLIGVVPFGLSNNRPIHSKPVLKGVYKTIKPDDQVILWGGGIWDWFDPLTLILAVAQIVKERPKVKLFFLGTQHPHQAKSGVPKMNMVKKAYELAESLGLLDTHVFFNDWVAYDERQNYLLEADIGVSLHNQIIETRYSFRTRILDYIWAELPIVASDGDVMAQLIETKQLGKVISIGDVTATKEALLELLSLEPNAKSVYNDNFKQVIAKMTWAEVCSPLSEFCRNPKRTPDQATITGLFQSSSWRQRYNRAWETLRQQGPIDLMKLGFSYLKWKIK